MDVLCFGSLIVDHRRPAADMGSADEPIRIVERAVDLRLGGVTILAAALRRLGLDVGLMGCVGRDIAGYGLLGYLETEIGLNVEAVRVTDAPTSTSFIRLTEEQRYVDHTPGASADLLPGEEEIEFVTRHRPSVVAIGYAGILPRLDADGGAQMARWISSVQETGALAALDTHTVPPYAMLENPVPRADVFLCNCEEAEGITGTSVDLGSCEAAGAAIWSRFPAADATRHRLFGVAMPQGVQLAYGKGDRFTAAWVANHEFGTFMPTDLTGAGDYFRAGVYAEIVEQREGFANGHLNLERVGLRGHETACQYLRRNGRE